LNARGRGPGEKKRKLDYQKASGDDDKRGSNGKGPYSEEENKSSYQIKARALQNLNEDRSKRLKDYRGETPQGIKKKTGHGAEGTGGKHSNGNNRA